VAAGVSAHVVLHVFFEGFDIIRQELPGDFSLTHWFTFGKQSLIEEYNTNQSIL
jgi:hypothetical protein